jgi:hypothetical protein
VLQHGLGTVLAAEHESEQAPKLATTHK